MVVRSAVRRDVSRVPVDMGVNTAGATRAASSSTSFLEPFLLLRLFNRAMSPSCSSQKKRMLEHGYWRYL